MRNPNPFTERQVRFLEAVRERIREINHPDPEIITHDSYEWYVGETKQFGRIPKISFKPESRREEIAQIRQKYGIRKARNTDARLFEAEWNNIMLKAKKAPFTAGYLNQLFAIREQTVADPITLLQRIVMDEYARQVKARREPIHAESDDLRKNQPNNDIRPYDEELAEMQ